MPDGLVYSTSGGKQKKQDKKDSSKGMTPFDGPAKMRLESKGRQGKLVTVLFDLPFDSKAAKKCMKDMQVLFGCGATIKNGTIELRGDLCDRVAEFFKKNNWKIIRAGG
ncbi:MAG: translation initiation factor [Proteobacteria bacterium]|nr:translation initiation factor [Pseudomonadota bacterium]